MGATKTIQYTNTEIAIAQFAKALGHPARIAIIQLLLKKQACICGDIVDELPISQSTVSQHLKALKEVGLIKGDIEGTSVCYCLNEKAWVKASALMGELLEKIAGNKNTCC